MGKYRLLDHTADVALRVCGDTLEDLFATAVAGWRFVTLESSPVADLGEKQFQVRGASPEELLVNFLSEINFTFQVGKWVAARVLELRLQRQAELWELVARVGGEFFRPNKHEIYTEIKAVTFHQLNIEKTAEGYCTNLVFDT